MFTAIQTLATDQFFHRFHFRGHATEHLLRIRMLQTEHALAGVTLSSGLKRELSVSVSVLSNVSVWPFRHYRPAVVDIFQLNFRRRQMQNVSFCFQVALHVRNVRSEQFHREYAVTVRCTVEVIVLFHHRIPHKCGRFVLECHTLQRLHPVLQLGLVQCVERERASFRDNRYLISLRWLVCDLHTILQRNDFRIFVILLVAYLKSLDAMATRFE